MTFSRLSLLWKIVIPTSLVMTAAFAITGWLVERSMGGYSTVPGPRRNSLAGRPAPFFLAGPTSMTKSCVPWILR